ncbi:LysM peptidoglycan-binding domain-containing protein [Aneurinibacillus migulanus]|uniref:LysM peptidoglycan-binding domain-containing protein n=1 Tax=Aneurinibacillus migulanus TaxID=47500 RepID=UPI00399CF2F8
MNMEFVIKETRKERTKRQQREKTKARKAKVAGITLSALVSTAELTLGANEAIAKNNTYTVSKRDTLSEIAMNYKTSVDKLKRANHLHTDTIYTGQKLVIPSDEKKKTSTTSGVRTQKEYVTSGIYTAVAGDSLWEIAHRFGTSVENLKEINHLKDDFILIGQKLKIQSGFLKTNARITGAEDGFTIEVIIENKPLSLRVPYGTAEKFQSMSGKEVAIVYKNGKSPVLLSYKEL